MRAHRHIAQRVPSRDRRRVIRWIGRPLLGCCCLVLPAADLPSMMTDEMSCGYCCLITQLRDDRSIIYPSHQLIALQANSTSLLKWGSNKEEERVK